MLLQSSNLLMSKLKSRNLHFFLFGGLLLMQMCNWGEPYRLLININLMFVIVYFMFEVNNADTAAYKQAMLILAIPSAFILLHMLSAGRIEFIKEMRLLILATSLTLGIWILARSNIDFVRRNMPAFTKILIMAYVLIQGIALFILHKPYGTTKNPHYLAQYSVLCIPITIYCLNRASAITTAVLLACTTVLSYFALYSSSRPAWLAFILSAFLIPFFTKSKQRIRVLMLIAGVLAFLSLINVANFDSRLADLAENISKEERVVIWQDTWRMQQSSSLGQWIYGHGLNSFFEDFKPYSRYHLQHIDFNSPHNHFLELLYTSGLIGVGLLLGLYYLLYRYLIFSLRNTQENSAINALLIIMLTIHLLFLMITIPFFRSYNLNVIALIAGAALFTRRLNYKSQ